MFNYQFNNNRWRPVSAYWTLFALIWLTQLLLRIVAAADDDEMINSVDFSDNIGNTYVVNSTVSEITDTVIDFLKHGICNASLINAPSARQLRLIDQFCQEFKPLNAPGRLEYRINHGAIFQTNENHVNENFVDCLKFFLDKACHAYIDSHKGRGDVWRSATVIITLVLFGTICYYNWLGRQERPATTNVNIRRNNNRRIEEITDPVSTNNNFENRFLALQTKLEEIKYQDKQLNDLREKIKKFGEENRDPIYLKIIENPVTLETGITYDRQSITEHLKEHNFCPVTKQILTNTSVFNTSILLRDKIGKELEDLEKDVVNMITAKEIELVDKKYN